MSLLKRERLDAEVLEGLRRDLGRRPRVLAWARTTDGVAVALPESLAVLRARGWTVIDWHRLAQASWGEGGDVFTWRTVERPHALESVTVSWPGRLPEVVQERVESTIAMRQVIELAPGVVATLVGRRPAAGAGDVEFSVVAPRGVNLRRPEIADAVERATAKARADWV